MLVRARRSQPRPPSLPGAQLRTVGRGRYVVQAGGSVAANAKNQPIVIEVPYAR